MKRILGLLILLTLGVGAHAQTPTTPAIAAMVCANNTIVPTPVNGQFFYVQCDSSGKLITTASSTAAGITIGTSVITGGTNTQVLFDDAGVVGESAGFTYIKATGLVQSTLLAIGGATIGSNALAVTGTSAFAGNITLGNTSGPQVINAAASSTTPTLVPNRADTTTGIGTQASGNLSLIIGGAEIGRITSSGLFVIGNAMSFGLRGGSSLITSPANASWQLGSADASSGAVAQTLTFQGNTGSTTNGPLALIRGAGGGSSTSIGGELRLSGGLSSAAAGTGGAVTIYTAPAASGATATLSVSVDSTGLVTLPKIASDAALTDTTVCQDTTNHGLRSGSGALGVCLGTSGRQFKLDIQPMTAGLDDLMKISLVNYHYKDGFGDNGARLQYGVTAQDVEAALPDLARHNLNGETINFDSGALLFIGLRAIQQLKTRIDQMEKAR